MKVTKKKVKIKKLVNKLKKLVYSYVFERDQSICQKCGKYVTGSNRHPSHIIPQSKGNALKFDPMNILTLCFYDHMIFWHKNPVEAGEWFKKKFPDRLKYLLKHKNKIVKFKELDYLTMINYWENLKGGI